MSCTGIGKKYGISRDFRRNSALGGDPVRAAALAIPLLPLPAVATLSRPPLMRLLRANHRVVARPLAFRSAGVGNDPGARTSGAGMRRKARIRGDKTPRRVAQVSYAAPHPGVRRAGLPGQTAQGGVLRRVGLKQLRDHRIDQAVFTLQEG